MRKQFLLFTLVLIGLLTIPRISKADNTDPTSNKAVMIPKSQVSNYSGTAYRLEFSEALLGDRNGGDTDRTGKSFTISTWVNLSELTGSSNAGTGDGTVIMGHGAQEHMNHNGSFYLCAKPNGKLYLGGGADNITGRDLNVDIITDTWTYLTIVYDNDAQSVSVYKDGVMVETVEMGHQLNLFGDDPAIFYVGGVMFSGMCDEFQYFNKALTTDNVLAAYNNPTEIDGLIALYDFNSIAEGTTGQFENIIKSSDKADIKAVYNKYTTNTVWAGNELVSGTVTEFTPTFANGRASTVSTYTVTLPEDVLNGTLTVMNGEIPLTIGENEIEAGTELTISAVPADNYELDYLKINDTDFVSGNIYTVNNNVTISVAFKHTSTVVTYCTPTFEKPGNVGIVMYAATEGAQTNLVYDNKVNGNNHSAGKPNGIVGNQIEVLAGSSINLNLFIDTYWGIAYGYADINGDGTFESSEKIGQWGDVATHDHEDHTNGIQCLTDGVAPIITIPADMAEGTIFRIRIIMGNPDESTACGTWKEGSYYDFEVKVVTVSASDQFTITFPETIENGTLTVNAGEKVITNGEKVDNGTELTITATPAEGYILDYLKINDTPLTESTYTVTEDVAITVAFSKEPAKATAKAIHIPTNSGKTQYQFRFDDLVLGEHKNGTNNNWSNGIVDKGDYRARNFTMSAWVRPLNSTGDLFGHAQKSFYGAEGTFAVRINANNQLVLKARAWVNGSQCDGIQEIVSDVTLDINEWAFLTVAVDDDARSIKLYKNGVLLSTGDLSATKNGTEAHGIGLLADECIFFAGNGSSSCDVDEIQVWSKTLNTEEIATSMNGYINAPENLVAFYKFDENSIENIPNQGTGGTCDANLVSGTSAYDPSVWGDVYTCSPIQATLVDGHILPKFAINYVSETEHGSFVIKNGDNVITPGSEVAQYTMLTVEATPAEGYQVKSIKVNDTEIEGNTFIVNGESTVSVEFTDKLTINYTVSGVGTFTVIDENDPENPFNSGDEFEKNTSITMVLAAGEGYEISSFIVNGEEQKESINAAGVYTIANCQTDLNIDVVFTKKLFNVTFSSNDFGTLTVKQNNVNIESSTPVEYGTELTVIATPNANATLSVFTINGADKLAEIQNTLKMNITVSEELDIQAEFTTISRTITCNIIGNGSVKIADAKDNVYENGVASIPDGSNITLTFIPEDGYQLNDFKYDGDSMFEDIIDNQFNFIADEDYTFDVVFTKITSLQNTSEDAVSVRYESGMLYVEGMNAGDKLDIYDITGKYIETSTLAATNVTDLANGCYLVRISLGNTIKTVKFIKR